LGVYHAGATRIAERLRGRHVAVQLTGTNDLSLEPQTTISGSLQAPAMVGATGIEPVTPPV
jgi:hypothetical protein